MDRQSTTGNQSASLALSASMDTYWARIKMLECLAEAYMKETGLPANRICLIQEIKDDQVLFYYKPL